MKIRFSIPSVLATAVGALCLVLTPYAAPAAGPQRVAISFDVHKLEEENVEGPNVVRTYFMVGNDRMIFGLPKGCRLTTGNEFVLVPTDPGVEGEIHVGLSPLAPGLDLTDSVDKYREAVSGQIPPGAKDIDVQPPVTDPYPFNGWQSLGFVCTYTFYGQSLRRTVNYVNLDGGAQIMVTTISSPASAEKMEKMARNFISSWWVKGNSPPAAKGS